MRARKLAGAAAMLLLGLGGCGVPQQPAANDPPAVLRDLAYSAQRQDCRVYLTENGQFEPFLVLTADYVGNCLLMREYLCDETSAYNRAGEYGSYYPGSIADRYLSETYLPQLGEAVRSALAETTIEVTTKHAIDTHEKQTETIRRKVFLLSAHEVNGSVTYSAVKEGRTLSYFMETARRIACRKDGTAGSWMLRTPAFHDGSAVMGIAADGSIGFGGINGPNGAYQNGVRPVFCLSGEMPLVQNGTDADGKVIYCLRAEQEERS